MLLDSILNLNLQIVSAENYIHVYSIDGPVCIILLRSVNSMVCLCNIWNMNIHLFDLKRELRSQD